MCKYVAAVVVLFAASSFADTWKDPVTGIQWTYVIKNNAVTIGTGSGAAIASSTSGDIVVPSTIRDKNVVSIGQYAFNYCTKIKSVEIPLGVTNISTCAFCHCSALETIEIPDTVVCWGNSVFSDCISLKSIQLPKFKTIPASFLSGCESLTDVTIPVTVCEIGAGAFSGCSGLGEIVIPEGVTNIQGSAFYKCTGLREVVIPKSVQGVGYDAFSGCDNLRSMTMLPIFEVYYMAMGETYLNLTNITILPGEKKIVDRAFNACKNLTSVSIPEGIETIGYQAFCQCAFSRIQFPESLRSIERNAFQYCENLNSVDIPYGVTNVDGYAFMECHNISSISLPSGWGISRSFGDSRGNITNVVILAGSEVIEDDAFYFPAAKSVSIPDTVKVIGENAMGFKAVERIIIPSGVESIGRFAFSSCEALKEIVIPNSVTNLGFRAFGDCTSLRRAALSEGLQEIPGCAFGYCPALAEVTIPSTVTKIENNAFVECRNIKNVTIPSGFSIRDIFPYSCGTITEVSFAIGAKSVGSNWNDGCTALRSVTIPATVEYIGWSDLSTVEEVTFRGACPENYLYSGIFSPRTVKLPAKGSSEYVTYPKLADVVKFKGLSGLMVRDEDGSVCLQVEGDLHIDWMDYISSTDLKSPFKMSVTRYFSDTTGMRYA